METNFVRETDTRGTNRKQINFELRIKKYIGMIFFYLYLNIKKLIYITKILKYLLKNMNKSTYLTLFVLVCY